MAIPPKNVEAFVPPYGPGLRMAQPGIVGLTWSRPHELRFELNSSQTNLYDIDIERNDEHWRKLLNNYVKDGAMSRNFAHSVLARVQFRRGIAQYKLSRYRMIGKSSDGLVQVKYSPVGEIVELLVDPKVDKLPSRERFDYILAAISNASVKSRQIISAENKQVNDDCFRMLMDPLTGDEVERFMQTDMKPAERIRIVPDEKQSGVRKELFEWSKAQDGEHEDLEPDVETFHERKEKKPTQVGDRMFLDLVEQAISATSGEPAAQAAAVKDEALSAAKNAARSVRNQSELNQLMESIESDIYNDSVALKNINERLKKVEKKKQQLHRESILGSVSPKAGTLKQQLWRRAGMSDLDSATVLSMKMEHRLRQNENLFEKVNKERAARDETDRKVSRK